MNTYVCFGRWDNLKSKIIRWVTSSNWSHVWLEYNSEQWGTRMVVHADSKGVVIEPVENFWSRRGKATHVLSYKVNNSNIEEGFKKSARYLGKDYGYFTLIWNALMLILLKIGFKEKQLVVARDLNKYICSEFAILFLKNARAVGIERLDSEGTWPGLLADFLRKDTTNYVQTLYEK